MQRHKIYYLAFSEGLCIHVFIYTCSVPSTGLYSNREVRSLRFRGSVEGECETKICDV